MRVSRTESEAPPRQSLVWPLTSALLVATAVAAGLALGRVGVGSAPASATAAAFTVSAALLSYRLSRRAHEAETLALRDPLTGLPNRMLLDDRIDRALEQAQREGTAFAALVVDLDGFKTVNDVRGHEAGDTVLRGIARRLSTVVRASDTVARVGGDEFVVLSPRTRTEAEAAILADRIGVALRRPYAVDGVPVEIDASIGWALYPRDGDTAESLLGHADGDMYASKAETESGPSRRGRVDAGVVREFESVLRSRELVVHFQPVIALPGGEVVAVEALVRRSHPRHGLVGPGSFVPHVERTPMIRALTLHVLDEGLREIREWAARDHELELWVNVPHRMLGDEELADGIARRLAAAGVPPGTLTLEASVTGGRIESEPRRTVVAAMVAGGVRLALDDVGRSAPLTALVGTPWHALKIDRALVREAGRDDRHTAVVGVLAALGRELGLSVVAEGVEHRDALDAAVAQGCDRAQGFFVQRPLPAHELTAWLEGGWPAAAELAS